MLERPFSEELNINERQEQQEIPEYTLGQRQDPPQFPQHYDDEKNDLLVQCLQKDVLWALANGAPSSENGEKLPLLGSWTAFNPILTGGGHFCPLLEICF